MSEAGDDSAACLRSLSVLGSPWKVLWSPDSFVSYVGRSCHAACDLSHQSDSLLFGSWATAWLLESGGKELCQFKRGRPKPAWLMIKRRIDFNSARTLIRLLSQGLTPLALLQLCPGVASGCRACAHSWQHPRDLNYPRGLSQALSSPAFG